MNSSKPLAISLIPLIIFCACGVPSDLFIAPEVSSSSTYGYTPEDPIRLGYGSPERSAILCSDYISRLRTPEGLPFVVIMRAAIDDPVHEVQQSSILGLPPKYYRFSTFTGGILDMYALVSADERDTVRLFFDIYHKDTVRVPAGLLFESGRVRRVNMAR